MHTAQKKQKNFILVTRDGETFSGSKISARKIIEVRFHQNLWPIYENTRGRKAFEVGSEIAFYIGGKSVDSGQIIARATLAAIKAAKDIRINNSDFIEDPPLLHLTFANIEFLKKPIIFRNKLQKLSFCPQNMNKWGVVLIGGCRQVDTRDWETLFN